MPLIKYKKTSALFLIIVFMAFMQTSFIKLIMYTQTRIITMNHPYYYIASDINDLYGNHYEFKKVMSLREMPIFEMLTRPFDTPDIPIYHLSPQLIIIDTPTSHKIYEWRFRRLSFKIAEKAYETSTQKERCIFYAKYRNTSPHRCFQFIGLEDK